MRLVFCLAVDRAPFAQRGEVALPLQLPEKRAEVGVRVGVFVRDQSHFKLHAESGRDLAQEGQTRRSRAAFE